MNNGQYYHDDKKSNLNLLNRVKQCTESMSPIDYQLQYDLANAQRNELSWEVFYELLRNPLERESGYWNAVNVASTLLMPVIRNTFNSNKNIRINENVNEDFLSNVKLAIKECIPGFNKDLSQFPNYIKTYIMHVGYVYDKDSSPYMEKTTGIRIFSQNSISDNSQSGKEGSASIDPYAQTKSSFKIEEELDKREKARNSNLFSALVINKKSLGNSEQSQNVQLAKLRKEALIKKTNHIFQQIEQNDFVNIDGEDITKSNVKSYLERTTKNDIKECNKIIEDDFNQTIVNASFWKLFLGGFTNFPDNVKNEILNEFSTEKGEIENEL